MNNSLGEIIIETQDLVYQYPNGTEALNHVSMRVFSHEILAVVGQNGSGKTTLVKHFNALLRATGGSVFIYGEKVNDTTKTSQLARRIGYVFQNPNHQLFSPTVKEELKFGLVNLGYRRDQIESSVDETIELFNLQPYLKVHPYSLSIGLRKLVAIASVYAMGPRVIILDEPTTGQDYESIQMISDVIRRLYEMGKSVIYISHNMSFVAEHAQRAIVMNKGKLTFDGSVRDLFMQENVLRPANLCTPKITELGKMLEIYKIIPCVLSVNELVDEIKRVAL